MNSYETLVSPEVFSQASSIEFDGSELTAAVNVDLNDPAIFRYRYKIEGHRLLLDVSVDGVCEIYNVDTTIKQVSNLWDAAKERQYDLEDAATDKRKLAVSRALTKLNIALHG